MKKKKIALSYIIISTVCVLMLVTDQVTKVLIDRHLPAAGIDVIGNFFAIRKVYNTGAAWGVLPNATMILAVVSMIVALLLLFAYTQADSNLVKLALGLLVAGAVGNVIDRFRLGYVIDFLSFYNLFGYSFPVFNVADICVTSGAIGILIFLIFYSRKKKMFRENTLCHRLLSEKDDKGQKAARSGGVNSETAAGENAAIEAPAAAENTAGKEASDE